MTVVNHTCLLLLLVSVKFSIIRFIKNIFGQLQFLKSLFLLKLNKLGDYTETSVYVLHSMLKCLLKQSSVTQLTPIKHTTQQNTLN